ncbi:MAG: alpha/beta fold hydrolase [Cytophagales bacterium]|nr:alpha/beta fold hydrolase [Armatimonadota bacterium]
MRETSQVVRIERHRLNEDLVGLTFSSLEGRDESALRRLVFVQHGLGSRKERHLDLCLQLAEAGFLACSLDARFHGDRATPEMRRQLSDIHNAEFPAAFLQTVQGTVQDISALATYFEADSYGLIGHSMGGFIALQTTIADPRVRGVVSVAGALPLTMPEDMRYSAEAASAMRQTDLAARAASLWPRPVLLLHGEADETVPLSGSARLYEALRPFYATEPQRLGFVPYVGADHSLAPAMAREAVAWMQKYLRSDREFYPGEHDTPR